MRYPTVEKVASRVLSFVDNNKERDFNLEIRIKRWPSSPLLLFLEVGAGFCGKEKEEILLGGGADG
jgi:hypothetical protein